MNIMVIILLIIAIFFAELSQKNKIWNEKEQHVYGRYEKFYMFPFICSFVILAVVCFCCKSGADMPVYVNFYSSWTAADFSNLQFEIGDKVLFVFLNRFIKNPYIGIGIIKILSIALIYRAIYLLRDKIKLSLAITAYLVLLYIFNFHLIRMMIAIGLVFLALSYEIVKKRLKCIILLVVAIFFHYSSCIVLIVYFGYLILSKKFSIGKILIVLFAMTFAYSNAIQIVSKLTKMDVFSKYTSYGTVTASGSGMLQIILFIPVALILFKSYQTEKEMSFYQIAFFCGVMTFFMGSMGYIYDVIGRLVYYFYYFFVIYGAATPLKKNDVVLKCGTFRINMSTVLIYLLLIMKAYAYFVLGNALDSNGLLQYTTIFY